MGNKEVGMRFLIQTYVIKIIKENLIHRTFQEF